MFKKNINKELNLEDRNDFLISISDLMTGIMMIFLLALLAVMFNKTRNISEYIKDIKKKEKLIEMKNEVLKNKVSDIKTKEDEIKKIKVELDLLNKEFKSKVSVLDSKEIELKDYKNKLDEINKELKSKISVLDSKEIELKGYKKKIDKIIGVKGDIIDQIKKKFKESASVFKLSVDDKSGAIMMSGDILFDVGSDVIKAEFKPVLENIIKTYAQILFGVEEFKQHLSEIVIEGHADNRGDYIYNLELSQKRAQSIMKYFVDAVEESQRVTLIKYVTASGRSFGNPILNDSGEIDLDKSRRIEVKFRLKDDDSMRELSNILKD